MFRELELRGRVGFPINSLDGNGLVAHSSVVTSLLKELLLVKSTKDHGYFLAITKLKSIGNGEIEEESSDIFFPVAFFCRTFLPVKGDVMLGVVHKIYKKGGLPEMRAHEIRLSISYKDAEFPLHSSENSRGVHE